MGEIIKMPGNVWKANHTFEDNPLVKKLQVNGSASVFSVNARRVGAGLPFHLLFTVTAEDNQPFHADYEVGPYKHSPLPAATGKLDNDKHTSDPINFGDDLHYSVDIKFKLSINVLDEVCPKFCRITPDLRSYMNRGRNIAIIGSDGRVTVSKRLLHLRSEAFEAMFKHDSKEKQTGQIDMKDFDSKTLGAFVHFLETGIVKDGKDTALGLILLGDKYDIQYMKQMAEEFVKNNIGEMDRNEVYDLFHKLNQESLKDAMVDSWSKKRNTQQ